MRRAYSFTNGAAAGWRPRPAGNNFDLVGTTRSRKPRDIAMKLRAAILVVWCLWPPLMAGAAEHLVETISSRGFQAIQVASQELERHNLHVADYRITVWHEGASVFVLFGDPNADPGQRGCCS